MMDNFKMMNFLKDLQNMKMEEYFMVILKMDKKVYLYFYYQSRLEYINFLIHQFNIKDYMLKILDMERDYLLINQKKNVFKKQYTIMECVKPNLINILKMP